MATVLHAPNREQVADQARLHWLQHPRLLATEIRTQPGAVTVLATLPS